MTGRISRLLAATAVVACFALPAGSTAAAPAQCSLDAGGYSGAGGPHETGPVARFQWAPVQPAAGRPATFDATGSSDADGDTIVAYAWNFGDGTAVVYTASPRIHHIFSTVGAYTVTLGIADCRDATASTRARLTVGVTAIAGTGSSTEARVCHSHRRVSLPLPHGHGQRVLSIRELSAGRTLRLFHSRALRGRHLAISLYGLPERPVTLIERIRRNGRVGTRRIVLHPCTRPSGRG